MELEVKETEIFITGQIRNYLIRRDSKVRKAKLKWFGHMQRRDSGYFGQKLLKIKLPKRREEEEHRDALWMNRKMVGVTKEEAKDRVRCRYMIH